MSAETTVTIGGHPHYNPYKDLYIDQLTNVYST